MPPPLDLLPALLPGVGRTLTVFGGATAIGLAAAITAGIGRTARTPLVRFPFAVYVEVFRGVSTIVLLFWFYYVLPFLGASLPALPTGMLVLGLNIGAYGAEVVRGAIQAVPSEQREAALALNLDRRTTLRRIVLPQAIPTMLPPAGNLLIELLKGTALVSLITIEELTFAAQTLRTDTLRTVEIFSLTLVLYFAVSQVLAWMVRRLERWYAARNGLRTA